MFTVDLSIPRWGSLEALCVRVSAAGGKPVDGVGELDPAGAVGFTASSLFHMGTLPQSEGLTSQGV
jgi:hypothetical protein